MTLHQSPGLYQLTVGRDISLGEVGCAYGHFAAYQHLLSTPDLWGLVLEDDAIMDEGVDAILDTTKHLKGACVISLIDLRGGIKSIKGEKFGLLQRMVTPGQATSAYLINRLAASIYLNNFQNFGITSPADWPYPQPKKISFFSAVPPLFKHIWDSPNSLIAQEREKAARSHYAPILLGDFRLSSAYTRMKQVREFGIPFAASFHPEIILKFRSLIANFYFSVQSLGKKLFEGLINRWGEQK